MANGKDVPCNNCNDGGLMEGLCYCDEDYTDAWAAIVIEERAEVSRLRKRVEELEAKLEKANDRLHYSTNPQPKRNLL